MLTKVIRPYGKLYNISDFLQDIITNHNTHLVLFCPQEHVPLAEPDIQRYAKSELFTKIANARTHMASHNVRVSIVVGRTKYPEYPEITYTDSCMIYWNEVFDAITDDVTYLADWWIKDGACRHYLSRHNATQFPLAYGELQHICTMRSQRPHFHRCVMMDSLAAEGLIHDQYSWRMLSSEYAEGRPYQFKHWQEKILDPGEYCLDAGMASENFDTFNTQHPGEMNSLIEVVAESTIHSVFWTEKTTKWLLYGKAFVIIGAPEINVRLQDLGFQLYDELISYQFDCGFDLQSRADGLARELDMLNSKYPTPESRQQLLTAIRPKLQHNHNRLLELINQDYPDNIPSWMDEDSVDMLNSVRNSINNQSV